MLVFLSVCLSICLSISIYLLQNYYQAKLFDFIISPKFESFTIILILVNIILMMFQHYQQSTEYDEMLYVTNLVFTVIFSLELILRIVALRQQYFLDRWNIFDLVIVIFSLIGKRILFFHLNSSILLIHI